MKNYTLFKILNKISNKLIIKKDRYQISILLFIFLTGSSIFAQQPPEADIIVNVSTISWVPQVSRVLNSGQVMRINGSGTYYGSIVVRSGAHIVVCGSASIFGSVNVNNGGHYWRTSSTGFTGSLTMNGTLHVGESSCNAVTLPEIEVKGNAVVIADDDVSPSSSDDTDFGAAVFSDETVTNTFTIFNTGTAVLNINGLITSSDIQFSVTQPNSTTIAAGSSETFTITFDPLTEGNHTSSIVIPNDDSNENPYNFDVVGEGTSNTFNCDANTYLFQFNDVYALDLASGSSYLVANDITEGRINGAGYNSKDGYIWGSLSIPCRSIVKVDKNFQTTIYNFPGLPSSNSYIGDISLDGIYYLKPHGLNYYMIDLDPASSNYLTLIGTGTLPQNLNIHDWAFNAVDNMLYTVEKTTNKIYRIDITSNTIENLGEVPILSGKDYTYGAVYFDLAGNFYISTNQTGTVYIVNDVSNITLGDAISSNIFSFGPSSNSNDGARCPTAPVLQEDCVNGVDDDGDGLVDCDDPVCSGVVDCPIITNPTSGGNDGGLESNNRLSAKLNKRNYNRVVTNYSFDKQNARKLTKNNTYASRRSNASFTLEDFVPLGVIHEDVSFESSPLDLINMTNATDLISVDYQKDNKNIASILVLKTADGVYEHSKYICDRLLGAELLSVSTIAIREHHFIKSIIKNIDGGLEFVLSFSAKESSNGENFEIESHWNIDKYEENVPFYNFQIWSNTPDNLYVLGNEVVNLLEVQKNIDSYDLSTPPPVFVKKGSYKNGVLSLNLVNSNLSDDILFEANYRKTETSDLLSMSSILNLENNYINNFNLSTGNLFDLGFRVGDGVTTSDDVFLSDGPWGVDDNAVSTQIVNYEVNINEETSLDTEFLIERNPYLKATTQEYVSIYKAFSPRFKPVDLSNFNALEFKAIGTGELEIRFIKESINTWENQFVTRVNLTAIEQQYQLPFINFFSENTDEMILDDVITAVFTLKSDGQVIETKEVSLKELKLTNLEVLNIEDVTSNNDFIVYPNPAGNNVTLAFRTAQLQHVAKMVIYDQLYREIKNEEFIIVNGENSLEYQVDKLQSGIYFISIKSDKLNFKPIKLIVK